MTISDLTDEFDWGEGYRRGYTDGRYDGLIQAYEIANKPHLADLVRLERANNRGEK